MSLCHTLVLLCNLSQLLLHLLEVGLVWGNYGNGILLSEISVSKCSSNTIVRNGSNLIRV